MKLVALISGGKDSCYNMLQCIAAGHEIIALANLYPEAKEEIDSYMYQSVGYEGVELYSQAMNLPLYRRQTKGQAKNQDKTYIPTSDDEVEDLYIILKQIKNEMGIEGVSVGAIMSDYQRVRVESVCIRLNLVAFAYLWRQDQGELLQEMIDCEIRAIIIKVAALGLNPQKHLGLTLDQMQPHLINLKQKYGINICGEGGEYESFTLDCSLFSKSIRLDESDIILHSNDAFAPVGYLNLKKLTLLDKNSGSQSAISKIPQYELIRHIHVKCPQDYVKDLGDSFESSDFLNQNTDDKSNDINITEMLKNVEVVENIEKFLTKNLTSIVVNDKNWCWIGSVIGNNESIVNALTDALDKLTALLSSKDLTLQNVICITMYVKSMNEYASLNEVYKTYFNHVNPPIRACVGTILPDNMPILLEVVAKNKTSQNPNFLHVQSISHWAPANIGPYSQAARINDIIYIAGMIPLIPGSMDMLNSGVLEQSKLALRHVQRVINAVDENTHIKNVVMGVCFVTQENHIDVARKEWENRSINAIIDYVVVSKLPRNAMIEWYVWAYRANNSFQYKETCYCVEDLYHVSLKRSWNNDNSVSAIVCYISLSQSLSKSGIAQKPLSNNKEVEKPLTEANFLEIVNDVLSKLLLGNKQLFPVANFRIFYRFSDFINISAIENVFDKLLSTNKNIAVTIVPVKHLQNPSTIISICAMSHY